MDNKWQEKIETDEDEFVNYSKGKYFSDKAFFEDMAKEKQSFDVISKCVASGPLKDANYHSAIAAGKYFEEDIAKEKVKVNSEIAAKSCTDLAGYLDKKVVRLETAKETTKHPPNGEASSKKSA